MASGADLNPPFKGGLPLTEEQLQQRWGGLKTGLERVDGPAPPTEAAAAIAASNRSPTNVPTSGSSSRS